ncbi:hypothetical protein [Pseudooceanicola marinus]|uniref:hypothetical protein n=1 Tax=Pseudooceanicola marinus TaxID=396013 RepID=UPI00117BA91B|nr:hypothetical protein [Pseudooceanicola marinus]
MTALRLGFFHQKGRIEKEVMPFQSFVLASAIFPFPSAEAQKSATPHYAQAGCGGRQTQGSGDIATEQSEYPK